MSPRKVQQAPRRATVVALGGHALQPPGHALDLESMREALAPVARALTRVWRAGPLVVTHGNGPQIGLLAARPGRRESLDVLGAETEGLLGHLLELELRQQGARELATLLTQVRVDPDDPAFAHPTKPIGGPLRGEEDAARAEERGWTLGADGEGERRRLVPSPEPCEILPLDAIRHLVGVGVLVIAGGGGGIPVVEREGELQGVEAVIDKDRISMLLARRLGARRLVLLTDVDAVYEDWGGPNRRPLREASPQELRALDLDAGSMGPKALAAADFVDHGGAEAVIGSLSDVDAVLEGRAGTRIRAASGRGSGASS